VSVADPAAPDVPLLAVSQEFERMSGYSAKEAIGQNCYFLSQGCECDWETRCKLHRATQLGEPIQATLLNRRKDGTKFLNYLNMRGVCFAKDLETGEDLWYLVSIHTDSEPVGGIGQMAEQMTQWHEEVAGRLYEALQELSGGRRCLEPRCSSVDMLGFQPADGKIQTGPKPLPQPQVALVAPRLVFHAEVKKQLCTKLRCGLGTALLCIGATFIAHQWQWLRASRL
jgi:hypothetical protein